VLAMAMRIPLVSFMRLHNPGDARREPGKRNRGRAPGAGGVAAAGARRRRAGAAGREPEAGRGGSRAGARVPG
jgi:hypothetical protein